MITITREKPEDFAKRTVRELPAIDRLKLNLFEYHDLNETVHFAGLRAGKTETLPLDSIWERDHKTPINSIYTMNGDGEKYDVLRQVDRVKVHISPEEFNLERRVSSPGEFLLFKNDGDSHGCGTELSYPNQ